jgi:uncharacterized protein (TIGR03437 family)
LLLGRFPNSPIQIGRLLSRRSVLRAGLAPLLAFPGSNDAAESAALLPLEGVDPGDLGLTVSADGKTAYVTFGSVDVVLVVDLQQGAVRSAIDVSAAGVMLASSQAVLSADGKLLFVANHGTENVMVIDTAQERVAQVLPVNASYGDCLKASAQGRVYIGCLGQLVVVDCNDLTYRILRVGGVVFNSIALSPSRANLLYTVGDPQRQGILRAINMDNGVVERQAVLPAEATDQNGNIKRLAVDPSGNMAYLGYNWPVNNCGSGNLTAFDLSDFRAMVTTPIEDGVSDLAIHQQTGKVYAVGSYEGPEVAGRVSNRLFINEWDPASRAVTRRLPVTPSSVIAGIQLDPANPRFAYLLDGGMRDFMRKVDLSTGMEVMRVRFFAGKRRPNAIATGGSLAYIACQQSPLISTLDLASGKVVGSLPLTGRAGAGGCEYYEGKLYLTGGNTVDVISATDGALLLRRTLPDGLSLSPKVSFFRDRIAAAAYLPGRSPDRVLILDAHTLDVVDSFALELTLIGRIGGALASPDGSKLYVQQGIQYQKTILQVLDSSTLRVLNRIEPPTATFQGGDGDLGAFDEQSRIAYLSGFCSIYKIHMDTNEFLGMLNVYDLYKEMGRARGWATSAIRGVDLTAARDKLLITSWDGHSVFMYDLRNQKWIPRVVRVGINPAGSAVSPDRKSLYTVNYLSDTIARVDTESGTLAEVTPLTGPASLLGVSNLRNAASLLMRPLAPGAVTTILESLPAELGPPFVTPARLDGSGRVATELGGTTVLFDGVPAPLLQAYAARVDVVAPYSIAGKKSVTVQLVYNGVETAPFVQNVADASPGVYTLDSSGQGQALMFHEDGTQNGPANPAARGSVVMFYATGLGQTDPPGVDGEITRDVLARPRLQVRAWVQGQEAEVVYAGAAPGSVSGVMQINIKVPMGLPSGDTLPIAIRAGALSFSQDGVTMAVR